MVKIAKIYTFFPKLSKNIMSSEEITIPAVSEEIPSSSSSNQIESSPETGTLNEGGTETKKRNLSDDSFIEELSKRPNLNSTSKSIGDLPSNNDNSVSDQPAVTFEESTPHWVELLFKSFDSLKFEMKTDIGTLNDKFDKFSHDTSLRLDALERDFTSFKQNQAKIVNDLMTIETETIALKSNLETLTHTSNKCIEKEFLLEKDSVALKQKNQELEKCVSFLSEKFDGFKKDIADLANNNCTLLNSISNLAKQMDHNEQHNRNECLLLHGVKEDPKETPSKSKDLFCKNICEHLGIEMQPNYIKRAHRLGQRKANGKPRPIIVRFYDPALRNDIFYKKRECKNKGISITENLTKLRMQKKLEAESKYGAQNVWTKEGRIYAKIEGEIKEIFA